MTRTWNRSVTLRRLLAILAILGGCRTEPAALPVPVPENPSAFGNCTAKVKVDVARLRSGPSLDSRIVGTRLQDDALFVLRVQGKWVLVVTASGDTAYMAAYLLSFPVHDMLEQWKRENPSPSVGKKAKVKWAAAGFRKYPSGSSPILGRFVRGDEVAVLADLGNGWALAESLTGDGKPGCYGFVATRSLAAPDVPDPPEWTAPLARLRRLAGAAPEPARESPGEYLARTAWSPEVFRAELDSRGGILASPGELLASAL